MTYEEREACDCDATAWCAMYKKCHRKMLGLEPFIAPPQREWQGLTMEETELLIREAAKFREGYINADFLNFAKLVAEVGQLLKEKNT